VITQVQRLRHVTGHVGSGDMKATDLNLSEMPAMTLHGPDGFGLTQYSGDEYALVGGFRDGSSNAGELRLKYQIYSHALIDANDGDFAKGEIGYCVVRVASDDGEDQGDILGLIDIELKPKYRKSGHGKKIVRDIVDTTKSGNLDIHDIQKKAKKFWDKMGVEYKGSQTGSAQNAVLKKQTESIDIASVAEIAKMAAVAGLAAPVMMAMIKAAYKTGKGINAIRKIANRAGVKLADRVMGEDARKMSRYNPDSKTYRYTTSGSLVPNSDTVSKKDITAKGQRSEFPDDSYDPDMLAGVNKEQLEKAVADSLVTLNKREEMIIRARFGLKPFTQDHTLKQVGDAMGVSPERVRQIEARALRKLKHPKRSEKLRGFVDEELTDFNKDEPNKSTVAVPGYGTMNIDSLMKNIIDQTTQMVKQMQGGAQGFRNADYALNSNKVLPTKVAALVKALDDLQAIRSKGGANSRNIQQEAEEEQQELPVDITRIINGIQEYESKQYIPQEDADIMRRGITALQTGRQSTGAAQKSVLQLLTMLMPK